MTKELIKAIMRRTKLRNQFLKKRTSEAKLKYNKQRNLCVNLLRKAKRNHYENLDLKDVDDNKKFWTTVKPLFCSKIKSVESITLDENGKLVRDEKEVANIMMLFVNIVPNLGINMISLIPQTFLIIRLKMLFISMRIILVPLQSKNIWKVLIPHFPFKLSQKRTLRNL